MNYKIETRAKGVPGLDPNKIYIVWRRFNHFRELNDEILGKDKYKGIILPPLPQSTYFKSTTPEFIEERQAALEKYLNVIANQQSDGKKEVILYDEIFKNFLTLSAEEKLV